MASITLHIDTSDTDTIAVTARGGAEVMKKTSASKTLKAQAVLPLILELLEDMQCSFDDISDIRVHTGPGSFTGVRVGVAVANALGWALGVPVNGSSVPVSITYAPSAFDAKQRK